MKLSSKPTCSLLVLHSIIIVVEEELVVDTKLNNLSQNHDIHFAEKSIELSNGVVVTQDRNLTDESLACVEGLLI